jgi:hypothetical protein
VHENDEPVGTEGDDEGHDPVHSPAAPAWVLLLENVDQLRSDCTLFHADSADVLSHATAAPAAFTVPQYDPVCTSASAPENASTCAPVKLVSANVTVHGRRQLLVQIGERLANRSTPSTASPVTLLSTASVQLTQWPPAACCSSHADGVDGAVLVDMAPALVAVDAAPVLVAVDAAHALVAMDAAPVLVAVDAAHALVAVDAAASHVDATVLRKWPYRAHPAAQIFTYVARTASQAAHVNADSVDTAGDPSCSPRYHAPWASSGSASVLDKVDHVRSDCTSFQPDAGDVLAHTRATPADLVAPQYDPACTAASAAENATVCP